MKNVILDIETQPLSNDELAQFKPIFEEPKTKGAKSAAEKEAAWLEDCTLHAHTSSLVAVGVKVGDVITIFEGDESRMILDTFAFLIGIEGKIVGHYIKGFDLPYLFRRAYINGVLPPLDYLKGRYFSDKIVDTMELWAAGEFKATISLDTLAKALKVGSKIKSDKLFYQTYQEDKINAREYLRNDLNITQLCAMKMGAI